MMKKFRWIMMFVFVFLMATMRIYANSPNLTAPKLKYKTVDLAIVKEHITTLFTNVESVNDEKQHIHFHPKEYFFLDDKIVIKRNDQSFAIYFSELKDYDVEISYPTNDLGKKNAVYTVTIKGVAKFFFVGGEGLEFAKSLVDDLYAIQYIINVDFFDKEFAKYIPIGEKYRSLKVKPPVLEEQRKFIVQAESCTQKKDYNKAIELYVQAINIDNTAFPMAYYNMALLYSQYDVQHAIFYAIFYMKIFLLLEPDSPEARNAQDKIYTWELRFRE